MRTKTIIALISIAVSATYCRNTSGSNGSSSSVKSGTTEISFREYQHDFGRVKEGEKISCIFTFDNKGTSDLIISSASTTCGCTVPKFDKKPIAPGSSGNLEVVFDTSGRDGMQTKTVTVRSNASTPVVLLKITAEVISSDK